MNPARSTPNRTWIPVLTTSICAVAAVLFFWTRTAEPAVEVRTSSDAEVTDSDFESRTVAVRERLTSLRERLDAKKRARPEPAPTQPAPKKPHVKKPPKPPAPRPELVITEECKRNPLCK